MTDERDEALYEEPAEPQDEEQQPEPDAEVTGETGAAAEPEGEDEGQDIGPAPYERFREVNAGRKARDEALAKNGLRFDPDTGDIVPLAADVPTESVAPPAADEDAQAEQQEREVEQTLDMWRRIARTPTARIVDEYGNVRDTKEAQEAWKNLTDFALLPAEQNGLGWSEEELQNALVDKAEMANLLRLVGEAEAQSRSHFESERSGRISARRERGVAGVRQRLQQAVTGPVFADNQVAREHLSQLTEAMLATETPPQDVDQALEAILELVYKATSTPPEARRVRGQRELVEGQAGQAVRGRAPSPRVDTRTRSYAAEFGQPPERLAAEMARIRGEK